MSTDHAARARSRKEESLKLTILATTILCAGLFAGIEILAFVQIVVVVVHTSLATSLTTRLLATLWVSSWCLLALTEVLTLSLALSLALATHVSEIVVLHSVICHVD
jgi:hypothetical protein